MNGKRAAALAALVVVLSLGYWMTQAGPLDPPPGPVTSTGRFGPRTEINSTNTPGDSSSQFKITQPGSYYLGGNVTGVAGKNGISIDADDVTLDLNGFALLGVAGSLDGVIAAEFPTLRTNLAIRNGTVADWGGNGIYIDLGFNIQIDKMRVARNTGNGILLEAGFLTNREEAKRLRDPRYLAGLAEQIAIGLDNYRSEEPTVAMGGVL